MNKKNKITKYRQYLEFTEDSTRHYAECKQKLEYINNFLSTAFKTSVITYLISILMCIVSDLAFFGDLGISLLPVFAGILPPAMGFAANYIKKPLLYGITSAMYVILGVLSAVYSVIPVSMILIYSIVMTLMNIRCTSLCCELDEIKKLKGYPYFNERLDAVPDTYVAESYTPVKERVSEMENLSPLTVQGLKDNTTQHKLSHNTPLPLDTNIPLPETESELGSDTLHNKPIPLPTPEEFYHINEKEEEEENASSQYQIYDSPSEGE